MKKLLVTLKIESAAGRRVRYCGLMAITWLITLYYEAALSHCHHTSSSAGHQPVMGASLLG